MCSGEASTAWIKEESLLKKINGSYYIHRIISPKHTLLQSDIIEKLFEYPEDFRNLCYLSLKGGEPFLEPTNYMILDRIIELGYAKNIILDLTTNGTIVDDRIFSYSEKFRQIKLHISIEGTGQLLFLLCPCLADDLDDSLDGSMEVTLELLQVAEANEASDDALLDLTGVLHLVQ